MSIPGKIGLGLVGRFTRGLRFPQLFLLVATLFVVDLLLPDLIPFIDEILLLLATLLLGSLEKKKADKESGEKPPIKDITPKDGATGGEVQELERGRDEG